MPSSIFIDRAHKFAENLADSRTKIQIERYLRQSDFVGPVVTFVGAEGRGKSTLFAKATHLTPAQPTGVQFAGTAEWRRPVNEMAVPKSIFHASSQEAVGEMLLCDAPAFGTPERDKLLSSLLAMTDFAVLAVQITQPAGADEIAFVKKRLAGVPAALVLTKCDQADDEDFQEGLEAILENYGDFPWLAILLSDLDGNVMETAERQQSLSTFEQWWPHEARVCAEEARIAHQKRLQKGWREEARKVLDGKEQEFVPQHQAVNQSLAASSSAAQAMRLQDELMDGLKALPERALALYKNRLSDLRVQVNQATHQFSDGIKTGNESSQAVIEKTLGEVYQEWDRDARGYVRGEIKSAIERLHQTATRYEELIRAATQTEGGTQLVQATARREEMFTERFDSQNHIDLQGEFDLTISEKLRTAATPTVSALGTGVLLLTVVSATVFFPLAPIIALLGAGVAGVGTFGTMAEGNKRRRASDLEKAIQRLSVEHEHQLQQQLYSEWKEFSDHVRDSISASKRQLNVLLMQQSPAQDSALSDKYKALSSNLAKIESLRRDLHWLEEHEQSAQLVGDTEE